MTSGGITKRTALFYTSAGFFVAAIICAMWGDDVVQKLSILGIAFGVIAALGSWASGLPKVEDPDAEEWAQSIK